MAKTIISIGDSFADIEKLFEWKKSATSNDEVEILIPWKNSQTFTSPQDENFFRTSMFAAEILFKESMEHKKFTVKLTYV